MKSVVHLSSLLVVQDRKNGIAATSTFTEKNRYKARNVLNCHTSGGSPSFILSSDLRHNGVMSETHIHPSV